MSCIPIEIVIHMLTLFNSNGLYKMYFKSPWRRLRSIQFEIAQVEAYDILAYV